MYEQFGLVLTVTHACNLRCAYCYAGDKSARTMDPSVGRRAIDRAVASLSTGGTLELGFFGGEPLLEAPLVATFAEYARRRTSDSGAGLAMNLTTNGTVTGRQAWAVMTMPDLELAVSCDGLPAVHDRHRCRPNGDGSAETVVGTIRRLLDAGVSVRVVMVVGPDALESLPDGISHIQELGVRHVEPALDVWARWSTDDISRLEQAIACCARLWRDGLPHRSIGWFDEKAAQLARVPIEPTARCGFGHGEVAVAPSGRLYPCERLIGEDAGDNSMAIPGHALEGASFLDGDGVPERSDENCDECVMSSMCNTICRCANHVRTGDVSRPDRLLCAWNQACLNETAAMLADLAPEGAVGAN